MKLIAVCLSVLFVALALSEGTEKTLGKLYLVSFKFCHSLIFAAIRIISKINLTFLYSFQTADCDLPVTDTEELNLCRALIPKFFYNSTSNECQKFIYGGCNGNGNSFDAKEQCEELCVQRIKN